jgi:hypothetical protein
VHCRDRTDLLVQQVSHATRITFADEFYPLQMTKRLGLMHSDFKLFLLKSSLEMVVTRLVGQLRQCTLVDIMDKIDIDAVQGIEDAQDHKATLA